MSASPDFSILVFRGSTVLKQFSMYYFFMHQTCVRWHYWHHSNRSQLSARGWLQSVSSIHVGQSIFPASWNTSTANTASETSFSLRPGRVTFDPSTKVKLFLFALKLFFWLPMSSLCDFPSPRSISDGLTGKTVIQ